MHVYDLCPLRIAYICTPTLCLEQQRVKPCPKKLQQVRLGLVSLCKPSMIETKPIQWRSLAFLVAKLTTSRPVWEVSLSKPSPIKTKLIQLHQLEFLTAELVTFEPGRKCLFLNLAQLNPN